jgi:hypothetical protein
LGLYANLKLDIEAALAAATTDTNGNTTVPSANKSHQIIYPSFGVGFEQGTTSHFRWEAKATGFAFPHRAAIWDAEASILLRIGQLNVLLGGRAFHFKTSPKGDDYVKANLFGPSLSLRWTASRGE